MLSRLKPEHAIAPQADRAAAPATARVRGLRYGLQPGSRVAIRDLAEDIRHAVAACQSADFAAGARRALCTSLGRDDLLGEFHQAGAPGDITRHLLYAHKTGLFSIQAIVWLPGQQTPVHGHTVWGAVGVWQGTPTAVNYATSCDDPRRIERIETGRVELEPGVTATVSPGIGQLHRIGNYSAEPCITIHVYGADLLACPGSINIVFSD